MKPFTGLSQEELSQEFDMTSLAYWLASFIVDPLAAGILGFLSAHIASKVIKSSYHQHHF